MTSESPFGRVTLSAALPGLPDWRIEVEVREGFRPFVAARAFEEQYVATFGRDAIDLALQPPPPAAPQAPSSASPSAPPKCNLHNRAMKASEKVPGQWYCTAKLADQSYCSEKVGP